MCASMDVFGGPTTALGTETEEGVVYSVSLKRVRYGGQMQAFKTTGHLQWNSQKIRTLKAGRVDKLVEHLAPLKDPPDFSYRTCFLCTYKTFTSSESVLQLLIQRYQSMEPCSSDRPKDAADKLLVQRHVISFINHWLETFPLDFYDPPSHPLLSKLHPLTCSSPPLQRLVDNLMLDFEMRDLVKRGRCGVSVDSGLGAPSEDSDPGEESDGFVYVGSDKNFDLCALTPKQFAESLTAEDAVVFQRVTPRHCLEYVREPKSLENGSSVRECIQHFNQVSLVVIATILEDPSFEVRGSTIGRWIDIAGECRAIKNFSSLKAILSGLQSSAIHRLERSWSLVPSSKISLFHELASLLAEDRNHQASRDLLNREGTAKYAQLSSPRKSKSVYSGMGVHGVVPYLGIFLTDLTMVNSAHNDLTETDLVNFDKRRKLFELLAQLTLYQKSAANYQFPSHPGLVQWLHSTPTLTQQESYQRSKALEGDSPASLASLQAPTHTAKNLLSPVRLKNKLKYMVNRRSSAVSDLHAFRPSRSSIPSHITKQISDTSSCDHLERLGGITPSTNEVQMKFKRSNSLSPTIGRQYSKSAEDASTTPHPLGGHVIKIAITDSDCFNYKCLQVDENDRASSVIQRALRKFSVDESPLEYSLVQIVKNERRIEITGDTNVYYALSETSDSEAVKATLLLMKI